MSFAIVRSEMGAEVVSPNARTEFGSRGCVPHRERVEGSYLQLKAARTIPDVSERTMGDTTPDPVRERTMANQTPRDQ